MIETPKDPWVEIGRYRTLDEAEQYALVLVAVGIETGIVRRPHGTGLLVSAANAVVALRELSAYERDNRPPPNPLAAHLPLHEGLGGLIAYWCALLFLHGAATRGLLSIDWVEAGAAQASLIVGGEWWRTVTALGLHADYEHLFSNLVAGGLFALFVAQIVGGGAAWLSILVAGGLGNALNALLQPATHTAIGASTAVFGAVGLLAVLMLAHQRSIWRHGLRRWVPLATGVMLLAFLGMEGERIDVIAHTAGFVVGCVMGAGLLVIGPEVTRQRNVQIACWVATAAIFFGAWGIALIAAAT